MQQAAHGPLRCQYRNTFCFYFCFDFLRKVCAPDISLENQYYKYSQRAVIPGVTDMYFTIKEELGFFRLPLGACGQ